MRSKSKSKLTDHNSYPASPYYDIIFVKLKAPMAVKNFEEY